MASKSLPLLRISYLAQRCMQHTNGARAVVERTHANVATSPSLENEQEEQRVHRELAKRCVSASAFTTIHGDHKTEVPRTLRCPVMKLSSVKRQIRTYGTTMNPYPSGDSFSRSTIPEEEHIIDVAVPRREHTGPQLKEFPSGLSKTTATLPGYGFTSLPFPLPLLPNVREQIEKMRAHEAELQAAKEAELEAKLAEAEEEERICYGLAQEARASAHRSLRAVYKESVQRFMASKGHH